MSKPPIEDCTFGMDGNKVCCWGPNHIDMVQSATGFGDTEQEAYEDYLAQLELEESFEPLEPFIGGHNED